MGHDNTPDRKDDAAPENAGPITDEAAEAAVGGKTWSFSDIMWAQQKAMMGDKSDFNQLINDLTPKPATEIPLIAAHVDVACPVQISGSIGGRIEKP